jgi:hypothetical protein
MRFVFLIVLFYGQCAEGSKNPEDRDYKKQLVTSALSAGISPSPRKTELKGISIKQLTRCKAYSPPKAQASFLTWFRHWARRIPK